MSRRECGGLYLRHLNDIFFSSTQAADRESADRHGWMGLACQLQWSVFLLVRRVQAAGRPRVKSQVLISTRILAQAYQNDKVAAGCLGT